MNKNLLLRITFLVVCSAFKLSLIAQNSCSEALPVSCNSVIESSTTGIANDNIGSGVLDCFTPLGTAGQQWYAYTATDNGTVTVSTVNSQTAFDTKIHVYTGSCGNLECIDSNDDYDGSLQSQVTFDISVSTTYLIRVGGFMDEEGDFNLSVSCDLASDGCTDAAACNFDPIAINDDGTCCLTNCITLDLYDQFANGWNGAVYTLTDSEGNIVSTGTLGGVTLTIDLCLADGEYTMTVTDGDAPEEIGWEFSALTEGILSDEYVGQIGSGTGTFVFGVNQTPNPGCTDINANNYDPLATIDDGSCLYCAIDEQAVVLNLFDVMGDGWNNADFIFTDSNQSVLFDGGLVTGSAGTFNGCLPAGCYNLEITEGDFPDDISWSLTTLGGSVINSGGAPAAISFAWIDENACGQEGCTDNTACNYDANATTDDGSCEFSSCVGCTDETACNYDSNATIDDGSCDFTSCVGCTDETACNYDANATIDNGSCDFTSCVGCTDETACNYNANATIDDGSCEFSSCVGCTDETACNYDSNATIDDGSCDFTSCVGCTDETACNYDANATIDDGSCDFTSCVGCTDETACNYNANATTDDGSCEFNSCVGCTDPAACNYNANATTDNGTCEYTSCAGCTIPIACNYDPAALISDCSLCEFTSCQGCTYPQATNYDPNATIDDGSCIMQSQPSSCPADLNLDGIISVEDLIIFLGVFGTECPE